MKSYPIDACGSRLYLTVVRCARRLLNAVANGSGMGLFHRWAKRIIPERMMVCAARISPQSVFLFEASDPYWGRYILEDGSYERSTIALVLEALAEVPAAFIDCGANYGYWSVLLSDPRYGSRQVLSVECCPATFEKLLRNLDANGRRFRCLRKAIGAVGGEELAVIQYDGHEGAKASRQRPRKNSWDAGRVASVTLDELRGELHAPRVIVKLDVEGAEPQAIEGAKEMIARDDALFLFEDHGKDPTCSAIAVMLDHGLIVCYPTDDGKILPIATLSDARRIKLNPTVGYNFVGVTRNGAFARIVADWIARAEVRSPDAAVIG